MSSQAAQDCSPKAPPLPGRDGPPWPAGWSAGVQGPQREAQTARDGLRSAWRPPCACLLSQRSLSWGQPGGVASVQPCPSDPCATKRDGQAAAESAFPRTHDSGCWGRGPVGIDTRCQGTASSFPEELGLDQSGRRPLAVSWVKHPLPPGASCLSLKETELGKGVTPAGWSCMGQGPRGASHGVGQGPQGGRSLPAPPGPCDRPVPSCFPRVSRQQHGLAGPWEWPLTWMSSAPGNQ